jgi:hypothetical protein
MTPIFAPTLTHARLRAGQGDPRGARRILRGILRREPEHAEARRLLAELDGLPQGKRRKHGPRSLPPPTPAGAESLSVKFRQALGPAEQPDRLARIERLRRWLARLERGRGDPR